MATGSAEYQSDVFKGLERVYSKPSETRDVELSTLKLVLFSDLHRGVRDGADDFQVCERAYNAALAYYLPAGYTLCLLGDAEELWECRPKPVLEKYRHSFELERKFRELGQYWRIWGNHDDLWSFPKAVKEYLGPVGLDVPVWESLRLKVWDHGEPLGEFFLVHGHQGTQDSEKYGQLSRLAVRYLWRNFQRVTKVASTTPAKDWKLRQKHDAAMYRWALSKRQQGLILFAGHTHRPIFRGESLVARLTRELEEHERLGDTPQLLEERRALEAELEWARSSEFQSPDALTMEAPCYFNTGCGSFSDGNVTALTISDGKIQLERWPNNAKKPLPQVLDTGPMDLRRCFADVRGVPQVPGGEVVPPPGPSPEGPVLH